MKSVSFSEVVYAHEVAPWLSPHRPRRRLATFALVMVLGLAGLVVLFRKLDPTAPLAYIVIPVLAGGLLPLFALMPARFEVTTRFEARHLLRALEEGLATLGYERIPMPPGFLRYRPRGGLRWPSRDIEVTLREHVLAVTGPAITLHALRKCLGAAPQG
ncbi:hypothetical protein NX773_14600 [Massilia solisilvae]|uniref:DUF2244 domain-containing protein n=1 Tax=Massilia solisilvae TaxID=1811225 RepID=A0ABT2BLP1_9BURK|nr:hypothetical protein [Massilia solisilvae]MCS0609397.1 hypothetical protein [Massilia solisilvae]